MLLLFSPSKWMKNWDFSLLVLPQWKFIIRPDCINYQFPGSMNLKWGMQIFRKIPLSLLIDIVNSIEPKESKKVGVKRSSWQVIKIINFLAFFSLLSFLWIFLYINWEKSSLTIDPHAVFWKIVYVKENFLISRVLFMYIINRKRKTLKHLKLLNWLLIDLVGRNLN